MDTADKALSTRRFTSSVWRVVSFVVLGVAICFGAVQARDGIGQQREPSRKPDGAEVFLTFCAGCHGFDGFAVYPPAPSFSMGQRLGKDDYTLLQNVMMGKNAMPPWQDKLPEPMLRDAIAYLRTMNSRRIAGLAPRTRPLPPTYFRFRPVGNMDPYLWYFLER